MRLSSASRPWMTTSYSLLSPSPMALLAGAKPGHAELAGVKQWWGSDISEIAVDAACHETQKLSLPCLISLIQRTKPVLKPKDLFHIFSHEGLV